MSQLHIGAELTQTMGHFAGSRPFAMPMEMKPKHDKFMRHLDNKYGEVDGKLIITYLPQLPVDVSSHLFMILIEDKNMNKLSVDLNDTHFSTNDVFFRLLEAGFAKRKNAIYDFEKINDWKSLLIKGDQGTPPAEELGEVFSSFYCGKYITDAYASFDEITYNIRDTNLTSEINSFNETTDEVIKIFEASMGKLEFFDTRLDKLEHIQNWLETHSAKSGCGGDLATGLLPDFIRYIANEIIKTKLE